MQVALPNISQADKLAIIEQSDTRLVLSGKPAITRWLFFLGLSPLLMPPMMMLAELLVAHDSGTPYSIQWEFLSVIFLMAVTGMAVIMPIIMVLVSYRKYVFDVDQNIFTVKNSKIAFKRPNIQKYKLSDISSIHIHERDRKLFIHSSSGHVDFTTLILTIGKRTICIRTKDQVEQTDSYAFMIQELAEKARRKVYGN